MKRSLIFVYGVVAYALFFVTFLYAVGFIGNIWVPKSIDSAPVLSFGWSMLINTALLTLFAVQHSGMARPAFKRWLTRFMPAAAERSTYVLLSTVCLALMMAFWAPLGGVVWNVVDPTAEAILIGCYFASWAFLLYSTFLIDHFDLFGLRQVFAALRNRPLPELRFVQPAIYKLVRHPIYVGWLGIVWFTPTMTMTHLVFALGASLYIFVGIKFEERDLEAIHPEYREYKQNVPAIIPRLRRSSVEKTATQSAQ